jgi:hypothetical protein
LCWWKDFFGRRRKSIAPFLDAVIHITMPLEIALARRMIRDINRGPRKDDSQKARDHVETFCRRYIEHLRDLSVVASKHSTKTANLVIDGQKSMKEMTTDLKQYIESTFVERP